MLNDSNGGKSRPSARDRAETTDHTARAIIDAEAVARLKKTEKLKAMRLEKQADQPPASASPAKASKTAAKAGAKTSTKAAAKPSAKKKQAS